MAVALLDVRGHVLADHLHAARHRVRARRVAPDHNVTSSTIAQTGHEHTTLTIKLEVVGSIPTQDTCMMGKSVCSESGYWLLWIKSVECEIQL